MNKNHSPKFSDEQLDRFAKFILQSTILTDEEIDEIVAAPQLRRQMLNRIADEKARRERHWFFAWRWQTATAGAFLFLFVAGAAIWFSRSPEAETAAVPNEKIKSVSDDKFVSPDIRPKTAKSTLNESPTINSPAAPKKSSSARNEQAASKAKSFRAAVAPPRTEKVKSARSPKTESATEFIALSYLPASESGQVVRVKVPRSMMVSLGVSTNVERSKELINAEVIVGDDGAARAIRFLND